MKKELLNHFKVQLKELQDNGLLKSERIISSPQSSVIEVVNGEKVINFCANNYLGLANHPYLVEAAQESAKNYGYGMASVRFICGTQETHKELEKSISAFIGTEDTILYSSCYDANTGLFETICGAEDAIISDELNHASIIDGIRLCKSLRYRYKNNDMTSLEDKLIEADKAGAKIKLIATDGVFSMDGIIADLKGICDLAEKYNALMMVDDSHAVGFMGLSGRGTPEYCDVEGRVDIITGTLGKALGGASGGYTSGHKEIIDWLRQRSRPYLFSNTLAPIITSVSIKVIEILEKSEELRVKLSQNSRYFRREMEKLGFNLVPGEHPIIPVMLKDALLATKFAQRMLEEGIYVVAFSYPVVPKGKARIRTQISAAHEIEHLEQAVAAFAVVGRELGIIS